MKKFKYTLIAALLALSPVMVLAQANSCAEVGSRLGEIICTVGQFISTLIPILVSLGVVYFIWGIIQYVIAGGEEDKKKGRDKIIYGLIGLAVIVGLWGLVNVVIRTFGLQGATVPTLEPLTGPGTGGSCQPINSSSDFAGLLGYFTCLINNSIIPLIFALAVVMFVWGAVKFFIINADEEAQRQQGRQFMIWGIVALAVMLSVWSLVGILGQTFGIKTNVLPKVCPPDQSDCNSG